MICPTRMLRDTIILTKTPSGRLSGLLHFNNREPGKHTLVKLQKGISCSHLKWCCGTIFHNLEKMFYGILIRTELDTYLLNKWVNEDSEKYILF